MSLDCNLQRPRPRLSTTPSSCALRSRLASSIPLAWFSRCLPRITVSCPSRIRICPRIRHVWGPDRIYRALNAAIGNRYRGATASSSYSLRLFLSFILSLAPPLLSLSLALLARARNFPLLSPTRVGPNPRSALLYWPSLFLLVVLLSHLFILRISVCQFSFFSPLIHPCEEFFKGWLSPPQTTAKFFSRRLALPPLFSSFSPLSHWCYQPTGLETLLAMAISIGLSITMNVIGRDSWPIAPLKYYN